MTGTEDRAGQIRKRAVFLGPDGEVVCPDHGDTLGYHDDQGDELEMREHLECTEPGCGYEVWA